jgi:hypothetical protein
LALLAHPLPLRLVQAFAQIEDRSVRRSLMTLTEGIARIARGRGENGSRPERATGRRRTVGSRRDDPAAVAEHGAIGSTATARPFRALPDQRVSLFSLLLGPKPAGRIEAAPRRAAAHRHGFRLLFAATGHLHDLRASGRRVGRSRIRLKAESPDTAPQRKVPDMDAI